jgi:hypothetical protein
MQDTLTRTSTSWMVFLLPMLCSCSFVLAGRPPPEPYDGSWPPRCEPSPLVPAAAVAGGVATGLVTGMVVAGSAISDEPVPAEGYVAIAGCTGTTVALLWSGIRGLRQRAACEEAHQVHRAWRLEEDRRLAEERRARRLEEEERMAELRALPKEQARLVLVNEYAESIFSLTLHEIEADQHIGVVRDQRIGPNSRHVLDGGLEARLGHSLRLQLEVMSLGERHRFTIETEIVPGGTFFIFYNWDTATARFRIRYGWEESS